MASQGLNVETFQGRVIATVDRQGGIRLPVRISVDTATNDMLVELLTLLSVRLITKGGGGFTPQGFSGLISINKTKGDHNVSGS